MKLPVVWLPEADVKEARAWYDDVRPALGEQFALAVDAAVEAISENPLRFPIVYRNQRRAGVRRFPTDHFRASGASDSGNRLFPRQMQSDTLAVALKD
ncbi:MAG: hypothetical protein JOZ29_16180 [Deltaproteobacteria bacterium]|nr:hypothetical protein [Deltaproteobacteria bacterium]